MDVGLRPRRPAGRALDRDGDMTRTTMVDRVEQSPLDDAVGGQDHRRVVDASRGTEMDTASAGLRVSVRSLDVGYRAGSCAAARVFAVSGILSLDGRVWGV